MKKIILLTIVAYLYCTSNIAQVVTKRGNSEWIKEQNAILSKNNIPLYKVSEEKINIAKSYFSKSEISALGPIIAESLTMYNSGVWESCGDSLDLWTLKLECKDANFLSVIFNEFQIPKGNELYIYNQSKTLLMGPFSNRNNIDGGNYATDIIDGESLIFEYHKLKMQSDSTKFIIGGVLYGIDTNVINSTKDDYDCLVDVNCPEGNDWGNQKKGTCFILKLGNSLNPETSGSPWASAALINNVRNNNIPYIFTAWHNTQGTGSDISLWIFRFKYWKNTCGGSINTETVSFCGGNLLEEWTNNGISNDVALIRMFENPSGVNDLFYCGWDISGIIPNSSTLLSHPQKGNHLMKISKSNNVYSSGRWWKSIWYVGGASGGSSGGPLFDENKRIIGAHHGRIGSNCNSDALAGKISYAANNNGKNGNKITMWLDPDNTGTTSLDGTLFCSDLYIKDVVTDNGDEPSNTNGCMWESPDIWIEDMSGNVVANPHSGSLYNVCVLVHNKKEIASTGTEKLYLNWAKAGVDLRWNDNWDGQHYFNCGALKGNSITTEAGVTIPSIPANSSAIVRVNWTTPNAISYENCTEFGAEDKWHFCLVARVHDGNTIPNENDNNAGLGGFVEHNNNVAWKNLSILNSKFPRTVVSVSNPFDAVRPFRLKYTTYPNGAKERLNKYAEVYLTLSSDLMKAWEREDCAGNGFKRVSENKILLIDDTVMLDKILLDPNTLYTIQSEVNFLTQAVPINDTFSFDLAQYDISKDIELIGGEHYIAIRDNNRDFKAVALSDTTVFASEVTTFTATTINENASYTWYNQSGDTIATGETLTTTPTSTQKYKLEVVAQSDGFKDYDTVSATVRNGAITLLSPNPATNQVSVTCRLASTINSAVINITSITGITVSTTSISGIQTTTTLNIQNLCAGQYSVQLLTTSGEILDSKILIIQ